MIATTYGKFRVETDALEYTIGGVLSQEQGKWIPIVFLSRMMQPAERNYKIYNKELLTIVKALTKWRQYLLNATEKFEVWTDHENLKYFRESHKLNRRQARWYLKLQDYDFLLWHISRKTNTKADILSRKDQVDTKDNNKNVQMLKEKLWEKQQIIADIKVIWKKQVVEETTLWEEIWWNRTKEHEVVKELDKQDGQAWEDNGIVYINGRIYISNNKKIWEQILQINYNLIDIRHLG